MKRIFSIAPLFLALALAGCGGGSNGVAPRTTASLTVIWPERGRLIPTAANSLQVALVDNGQTVAQQVIARPASGETQTQADFTDLPVGTFDIAIKAFPTTDATGVAQATGAGTMTATVETPGTATISLVSTVSTLTIAPSTATLGKGLTRSLAVNAKDAANNIVLLTAGGGTEPLTWSCDNTSIASLTGTNLTASTKGLVTGSTTIRVSMAKDDSGTLVQGTLPLTIVPASGTVTVK